jgi:hypothetical protein
LKSYESDYGTGFDLGVQLQFIHPGPLTSYVPLRLLLPLRIGASVQNLLLRPHAGFGEESDDFPTVYRFGFSYMVIISPMTRLLVTGDAVKQDWHSKSWGYHLGTEFSIDNNLAPVSLRLGGYYRSQQWRPTAGLGIGYTVSKKLMVAFDFAQEFHDVLIGDQRVALKLVYGPDRDAGMYKRLADQSSGDSGDRYYRALEALTCYPYVNHEIKTGDCRLMPVGQAAMLLADTLDTERRARYRQFIGAVYYGDPLVRIARDLLRKGDDDGARANAREAVKLCESSAKSNSECEQIKVVCAEAYVILAETDPDHASRHARDALDYLAGAETSDFSHYLSGRCYQKMGGTSNLDAAYAEYTAVGDDADERLDIYRLSRIQAAACLCQSSARDTLMLSELLKELREEIVEDSREQLSDEYLPYPRHRDGSVADDAQYYIGGLNVRLGKIDKAKAAYAKVCRFYPLKSRCRDGTAEEALKSLMK